LGAAITADDVRLPLVREDRCPACPLQCGDAAEVRAMRVRDCDPLQVLRASAEVPNRGEDERGVGFEQRVNERELAAIIDQEGADMTALAVAEAVDAGGELSHTPSRS